MKIEEIYRQLDNYQNQLNANREKFEKIYNENISSMTEKRNIILTIITFLAGFSVAITEFKNYNEFFLSPSMVFLISLVLVGIFIYIAFFLIKRERNKKVLVILKEFHDGFTTISFMKGFLDRISLVFENLEKDQLEVLDDYYTMVKGGIGFQIRSKIEKSVKGGFLFQIRRVITKSVKEAAAYGFIEEKLYDMLISNASKIYKDQKKKPKEEKDKEETKLKNLFILDDKKYNSLKLKEQIFDIYKKVLENKCLIIGELVKNKEDEKIGKIVKFEVDNDKSYITIEGHSIYKSFRKGNSINGSENCISEREDSQESLLPFIHRYKIPLEPLKIEDWEYGKPVKLEKDYSKE